MWNNSATVKTAEFSKSSEFIIVVSEWKAQRSTFSSTKLSRNPIGQKRPKLFTNMTYILEIEMSLKEAITYLFNRDCRSVSDTVPISLLPASLNRKTSDEDCKRISKYETNCSWWVVAEIHHLKSKTETTITARFLHTCAILNRHKLLPQEYFETNLMRIAFKIPTS